MNSGVIKDKKVWQTILEWLPGTVESWSKNANTNVRTLQAWKRGKNCPREDSLTQFLKALQDNLSKSERKELIELILKDMGITKAQSITLFKVKAQKDFVSLLRDVLKQSKSLESIYYNKNPRTELLNMMLMQKLRHWFMSEQHVSVEIMGGYERNAFLITINDRSKAIPPVIFSYLTEMSNAAEEEKSLKEFHEKYKGDFLLHIAATLVPVDNDKYKRIIKKYNVYIKTIRNKEFQIKEIRNKYICLEDNATTEREVNLFAEVIFRKFLESSYLIYKEILCWKHDVAHVNYNFFQSNIGIGNYPYAMRRAISFEKKAIENELKRRQNESGKKIDLFIDLNCLGGLYGLRLSQYCKQVLCVDESMRAKKAVDNILTAYNQDSKAQKIVNVMSELFREETNDILANTNYRNKADCIAVGLGTISYMKSPEILLRKISDWLKPDGVVFLSCYNINSLSLQLRKFENLNYEYDFYNQRFTYGRERLNIPVPVKMFSFTKFKNMIKKYFEFDGKSAWSYPVISSIFPVNEYGQGIDIIKEVDKASASYSHDQLTSGNYNIVLAGQYKELYTSELYDKTKKIMEGLRLDYQEISHDALVSPQALMEKLEEMEIAFDSFIKSVLVEDVSDVRRIRYYMILLPFVEGFRWKLLERHYKEKKYIYKQAKIKFCDEMTLRQLGFTAGSICPFSCSVLKESYDIELLYDYSIERLLCMEVYTYSGQNNSTYKLPIESLKKYLEKMEACTYRIE